MDELDRQLVAQYVEGDMNDDEFALFQQRLRDDTAVRERLRTELNLESGLRDLAAADSRVTELWRESEDRVAEQKKKYVTSRWVRLSIGAGLSIVAAACVVAFIWPFLRAEKTSITATLRYSSGNVAVVDARGNRRNVENDGSLLSGDKIKTSGDDSVATIAFDDGARASSVSVVGDSSLSLAGIQTKRIILLSGMMSANVPKQPDASLMVISTPNDSVEVLNAPDKCLETEFALEASPNHTDIHVSKGQVALTRTRDGKSVVIRQGERVVSDGFTPKLAAQDSGKVGETWEEDFEAGLPLGWQQGKLVHDELPEHSLGAVRNEYFSRWDAYLIDSQKRWVDGLFVVQDDTHIHFTFKMEQPGWLNIFCMARTNDETDPTDLFQCNSAPFQRAESSKWYTMTIPIGEWKRNDDIHDHGFVDPPPEPGEKIYVMSWSSRRVDRGLVIDRVWVTRGGPRRIEMTKHPMTKE